MRFLMPLHPLELEIPNEWLVGIAHSRSERRGVAYRTPASATPIPLAGIEPPRPNLHVAYDWRGFDRERFLYVLTRMTAGLARVLAHPSNR